MDMIRFFVEVIAVTGGLIAGISAIILGVWFVGTRIQERKDRKSFRKDVYEHPEKLEKWFKQNEWKG